MTLATRATHPLSARGTAFPSKTGLAIVDGTGFNEARDITAKVIAMGDSSNWWIGDALVYMNRFRRDYTDAMGNLDELYAAHKVLRWVAASVDPVTRVTGLSWTHHRIIAPLEAADQRYFLGEALRHGWTSRELVDAIAERVGLPAPAAAHEPALTIRTADDLSALCIRAAIHAGLAPALWATGVLERAARLELA